MIKKKFFKTRDEADVTFEFARDDISKVQLVAEFNQWQPLPMSFNKKDKVFRTKIRLPKDAAFSYKYLLDEQEWENDYQADNYIPNAFGGDDSVVYTQQI